MSLEQSAGAKHDFLSFTKVFELDPRVKEEMLYILRRREMTRFRRLSVLKLSRVGNLGGGEKLDTEIS